MHDYTLEETNSFYNVLKLFIHIQQYSVISDFNDVLVNSTNVSQVTCKLA